MKPSSLTTPASEEANPGGQHRFTRAEYDRLTPFQQGLVTYLQGQWNKNVPNWNFYRRDSKQHREFTEGEQRGVMITQDGDDE